MAELKNGFFYTTEEGETSFINISLDGKNISTSENGPTLEQSLSKQEKIEEKVISCLTDKSIDRAGVGNQDGGLVFPIDVSYYRNLIIYIGSQTMYNGSTGTKDRLYIENGTTGWQYRIYNNADQDYTYEWNLGIAKKLYVYDDDDNFYIYVGVIDDTTFQIDKITIEKNSSGDISYLNGGTILSPYYDSATYADLNTVYQTTLDDEYELNGFYVNEAGTMAFASLTDASGSYLLTVNLTTSTSWGVPNGLITATSSRIHVCPDVFEEDRFYALYDNQAISVSGGANYQTALKTIQLPYTINETNGHIDYFGGYIVYTTDGSNFYITNVATSETKQITCEDELLSFDASKIVELRVKKYTLSGELQFYIGTDDSRHIKFYSDTTSYVRVNYNFLSPYTKPILKICADPYKNTEKVLIAYNSGRNQIRVLNENVGTAGAAYFAKEYDTLQKVEGYEDEIRVLNAQVNTINNELDNFAINSYTKNIENTSLHGTRGAGQYYYLGAEGPILRQSGEYILVDIGKTGIGYGGVYQKLYYPTQKRQFIRYSKDTYLNSWSDWQEILASTDFDNFENGKLAVYDNKTGFKTSNLDPGQILTYDSKLLTDGYNPESFLSRGSYYNIGPNKIDFEDMTGTIGDITLSVAYEKGSYPFSIVASNNDTLTIPAVYNSAFTSYTQGETEPFYFSLGMIVDYDITGLGQQEVFRLFNTLVLHMNSNSSARIVATAGVNGTALEVSDWLASPGLCALAISGTNNGTVTLEIQPLYSNYTKKGNSVSTSISLASDSLYYNSSNKNSYIYLRQGINLSSLYLDSGSYIINSGTNPVLSTTEIINALVNIKQDASSPIASQNYVDSKADKQTPNGGFAAGQDASATSGGAIGNGASANTGGAVGREASANTGGAVGYGAKTSDGFAGGYNAQTVDENNNKIDAIQLGEGTNSVAKTLQVYEYQLMDANGNIPKERLKTSNGGFAAGDGASATFGGAVGDGASATSGGAVGQNAEETSGGFAGGSGAYATYGGAIGSNAYATTGGAVGNNASTSNGGAVGYGTSATSGGAVGYRAKTSTGFAGGYNARTQDSSGDAINAIQLGTGTNSVEKTLQVYDYQLMDANGQIPEARMSSLSSAKHTHSNKTVLDSITSTTINNWNNKVDTSDLPNIKKNSSSTSGDIISSHITIGSRGSGTYGTRTLAIGTTNVVSASNSVVVGSGNNSSAYYSLVVGQNHTPSGYGNGIFGLNSSTTGNYSLCSGTDNEIGGYSVGMGSHISSPSNQGYCFGFGFSLETSGNNTAIGHHNKAMTKSSSSGTSGDAFVIGNGSDSAKSNAFRVTYAGAVYGKSSYHSTGADYAEYFEWEDGNSLNEDRRGLFVTWGNKGTVKIAQEQDEIIGVVSVKPSIVGNAYEDDWQGMYKTDIFGEPITHIVHYEATYREIEVPDVDKEGNLLETTHIEKQLEHEAYDAEEYILNEDYDPSQEYIPRSQRKEWAVIGLIGQLVVVDDGSCYANGYCKVGENGIATMSSTGCRVLSRLDENHIKIYVK